MVEQTFPPRTSSPMIMHPAVCIMRLVLSSAVAIMLVLIEAREVAAEE